MQHDLPEFNLEQFLPFRFTILAAQLSADLSKMYKSKYGISTPEWRVLLNVGYTQNLSVRDIEKRTSLNTSKVSRAASKLEAKGYITKEIDDADRRLLKLALTQQGAEILNELIPLAHTFQERLNEILGDQEKALQHSLNLLTEKLNDKTL